MESSDFFLKFSFELSLVQEVKEEFQKDSMEEEVDCNLEGSRNDENPAENSVVCFVKSHICVYIVLNYRIWSWKQKNNDECSVFYNLD